ncbi:hypothetical protein [Actinoplanes sp. NPDC051411]|uniref:hypothetical protein n=1 Tax=Actinoplanes sp. NPDC051411 TaxID=3155522 RepID=UPI00342FEA5D
MVSGRATGRATGRRGRWAVLPAAEDLPEETGLVSRLGPVVVRLALDDGHLVVDLSDLPCPRLARQIGAALLDVVSGGRRSVTSVKASVVAVRRFVSFIADTRLVEMAGLDLVNLHGADLDEFERALINEYGPESRRPHSLMELVVGLFRVAAASAPCSAELRTRLQMTTRVAPARTRAPLDAYPSPVFESIKTAALADVRAVAKRIQQGEALARNGTDPEVGGWDRVENLLWQISHRGPLAATDQRGYPVPALAACGGARYLNGMLYPMAEDILAFVVAVACLTGLEPECVRGLRADCVSDPARGFVSLHYLKRRAGPAARKSMRIADGGAVHHPGGLIRLAQRVTERARTQLGTDALWVAWARQGQGLFEAFASGRGAVIEYVPRWLRRHGLDQLHDHDGLLRRIDLRRLRKSVKSQQYLRSAGVLADFVQGHSKQVAASHYADIGAHRDIHEQAVEDGLREALDLAAPPVVLSDDGARLDDGPTPLPPQEVSAALSGHSDVFLASCRDFHNTPHAPAGKPCPVPMWGCLECPNAVFTTRHLPQVLTFLDFVERQRDELAATEWASRYRTAHERIVHGVRNRFSADQLATAHAITESGGPLLLPADFWEGLR